MRFQCVTDHESRIRFCVLVRGTFSRLRMLKIGCRIELMLGPRNFCCRDPRAIFDSYSLNFVFKVLTNLYARRRRLVIHLTPDSFGKNLTNE